MDEYRKQYFTVVHINHSSCDSIYFPSFYFKTEECACIHTWARICEKSISQQLFFLKTDLQSGCGGGRCQVADIIILRKLNILYLE